MDSARKPIIGIIKLGIGNIGSVSNMLKHIDSMPAIIECPSKISSMDAIVLAGVGAFDTAAKALKLAGWDSAIQQLVAENKRPILGICLGMQLFANGSEEGTLPGLGIVPGFVKRLQTIENSTLRIPHMGWDTVVPKKDVNGFGFNETCPTRFYFTHSYHMECADSSDVWLTCNYGSQFVAACQRKKIFGVQFHPEKSHRFGMSFMRAFVGSLNVIP